MEQRDHADESTNGMACAACGRTVPAERTRLLAAREDLAFAELRCPSCSSLSLAIVMGPGSRHPGEDGAFPGRPPLQPDDVLDMHELLAGYRGDLRGLVARRAAQPGDRRTGAA